MSDVVFILGAVASKQAGVPLTGEFLDAARDLLAKGEVGDAEAEKAFRNVFKAIGALQKAHSKSTLDLVNVESVFVAFEMAKVLGLSYGEQPDYICGLLSDMKTLIARTVEGTLLFKIRDERADFPVQYEEFADLIEQLTKKVSPPKTISVITFNYDIATDWALAKKDLLYRYYLPDENPPSGQTVPLLKLHGSLNWITSGDPDVLKLVKVVTVRDLANCTYPVVISLDRVVPVSSVLSLFVSAENCTRPQPLIIPPTFNKASQHGALSTVWRQAATELRGARDIYVIGYSFPRSDSFFEFLYSLGTIHDEKILRRFWVFNPDRSRAVEGRFRALLGPGALHRFNYFHKTFAEAIPMIQKEYVP